MFNIDFLEELEIWFILVSNHRIKKFESEVGNALNFDMKDKFC